MLPLTCCSLVSFLQRINKLREEDPDLCLRLEVDGGGCQGFQYNFKLEKLGEIDAEVDKYGILRHWLRA